MKHKRVIETNRAPSAIGTYSQAVISGQIGLHPKSMMLINDSIQNEIRQVFRNLHEIIKKAEATFDQVVKFNVYLTNLKDFDTVNQVMEDFLQPPFPARAAIGVSQLPKGANVEIDAIVYISDIR